MRNGEDTSSIDQPSDNNPVSDQSVNWWEYPNAEPKNPVVAASSLATMTPAEVQKNVLDKGPDAPPSNRWYSFKGALYAGWESNWNVTHDLVGGTAEMWDKYIMRDPGAAQQYSEAWTQNQKDAEAEVNSLPSDGFVNSWLIKGGGGLLGGFTDLLTLGVGSKIHAGVGLAEDAVKAMLPDAAKAAAETAAGKVGTEVTKGAISGALTGAAMGTAAATINPDAHFDEIPSLMKSYAFAGGFLGGVAPALKGIYDYGKVKLFSDSKVGVEPIADAALREEQDKAATTPGNTEEDIEAKYNEINSKSEKVKANISDILDEVNNSPELLDQASKMPLYDSMHALAEKGVVRGIEEEHPEIKDKVSILKKAIRSGVYGRGPAARLKKLFNTPDSLIKPEDEEFIKNVKSHEGEKIELEQQTTKAQKAQYSLQRNARLDKIIADKGEAKTQNEVQSRIIPKLQSQLSELSDLNDQKKIIQNSAQRLSQPVGNPAARAKVDMVENINRQQDANGPPNAVNILNQKIDESAPYNVKEAQPEFESSMDNRIKDLDLTDQDKEELDEVRELQANDKHEKKIVSNTLKCILGIGA